MNKDSNKKARKFNYLRSYRSVTSRFVDEFNRVMTIFCESDFSWYTIALNCGCSFEFIQSCYLGTVRVSDIPYLVFERMKAFANYIESSIND